MDPTRPEDRIVSRNRFGELLAAHETCRQRVADVADIKWEHRVYTPPRPPRDSDGQEDTRETKRGV